MSFCLFSSAQKSGGTVACIEVTLARTCSALRAPTISAAATSGAAEKSSAAVRRSTPYWAATARSFSRFSMYLRGIRIVSEVVTRTARDEPCVEGRADHEFDIALSRHGKDVVEGVGMVDQRVLRYEQAPCMTLRVLNNVGMRALD